jgi:hypothetical protein
VVPIRKMCRQRRNQNRTTVIDIMECRSAFLDPINLLSISSNVVGRPGLKAAQIF